MPREIVFNKFITVTWRGVKRSDDGGQAVTSETGIHDSLMKTDLLSARNDINPIDLQGYPARDAITALIMLSWLLSESLRFVSPTVDPAVVKVSQVHNIPSYPVKSTLTHKQFSQVAFPARFSDLTPACCSLFSHRLHTPCHLYSPDLIILIICAESANHEVTNRTAIRFLILLPSVSLFSSQPSVMVICYSHISDYE